MKLVILGLVGLVGLLASMLLVGIANAASYQSVYCYDTGSYWQTQKAAYPDYYAANDAYYRALYGPGTFYCQ
jgi:hypothetical protein